MTLPAATYVLDPADYGLYAQVTAFTTVGSVIATLGSGVVLAAHFPVLDSMERSRLISTMSLGGVLFFCVFAVVFLLGWKLVLTTWPGWLEVPPLAIYTALIAAGLSFPWSIALDVITLEGRAMTYSVTTIVQSIVSALVLLGSLYLLELDVLALFLSLLASSFVCFLGAATVLYPYWRERPRAKWLSLTFRCGIPTAFSQGLETTSTLVERSMLSAHAGYSQLGIFTHSQQYRAFVGTGIKALARTMWPISLGEARGGNSYVKTGVTWNAAYVSITVAGILFATLGRDAISFLSHGKFTEAYILASLWMASLLVQNAGKPHTAALYASGRGHHFGYMLNVTTAIGIGLLVLLVPIIGIYGAALATFSAQILFRVGIRLLLRKARVPNQDLWVILGVGLILLVLFAVVEFELALIGRIVVLISSLSVLLLLSRSRLQPLFIHISGTQRAAGS